MESIGRSVMLGFPSSRCLSSKKMHTHKNSFRREAPGQRLAGVVPCKIFKSSLIRQIWGNRVHSYGSIAWKAGVANCIGAGDLIHNFLHTFLFLI